MCFHTHIHVHVLVFYLLIILLRLKEIWGGKNLFTFPAHGPSLRVPEAGTQARTDSEAIKNCC